jgi:hypothetical protein
MRRMISVIVILLAGVLLSSCRFFEDPVSLDVPIEIGRTLELDEVYGLDNVPITVGYDKKDDVVLDLSDKDVIIEEGILELDEGGTTVHVVDTSTVGDHHIRITYKDLTWSLAYTVVDPDDVQDPHPGDDELPDPPSL